MLRQPFNKSNVHKLKLKYINLYNIPVTYADSILKEHVAIIIIIINDVL